MRTSPIVLTTFCAVNHASAVQPSPAAALLPSLRAVSSAFSFAALTIKLRSSISFLVLVDAKAARKTAPRFLFSSCAGAGTGILRH